MSYFGVNIRKLRRLKSLSQTELAEQIGLKRGALSAYEEGRSEPKIETMINVANIFSISIDGLLTRELSINELLNFNTALTTDESQLRKAYPKIPFISKEYHKAYVKNHDKKSFISKMRFMEWPVEDHSLAYRFYEVLGLEMSNETGGFYPKDILLLKKQNINAIKQPLKGLVVYDDIKFRNLQLKNSQLVLKAEHPAIDDIVLEKSKVSEVWVLEGAYQKFREFM